MKREELMNKTDTVIADTQSALQTMYNALHHGQQQKKLKNEEVKALFDRYHVDY